MNTKNKVALCNNLNMNFDEASELFCEESLQSMQMAQINGGAEWWDNFCSWIRRIFKNINIDTTPQYTPDGKGGGSISGFRVICSTTIRPTADGISYFNGGMTLCNSGVTVTFFESRNGIFESSNGTYTEISSDSTPTPV